MGCVFLIVVLTIDLINNVRHKLCLNTPTKIIIMVVKIYKNIKYNYILTCVLPNRSISLLYDVLIMRCIRPNVFVAMFLSEPINVM